MKFILHSANAVKDLTETILQVVTLSSLKKFFEMFEITRIVDLNVTTKSETDSDTGLLTYVNCLYESLLDVHKL